MMSGFYAKITPDEPVLDLCVRKVEKQCATPEPICPNLNQPFYDDKHSSASEHGESLSPASPHSSTCYSPVPILHRGKPTRPFKAYPKDPLSLANTTTDGVTGDSIEAYAEFRKRMLEQVHAINSTGHKNMRRPVPSCSPTHQQPSSSLDSRDSAYWERRRKNNEAAKRSRDARRAKEDEIAIRAAFLEQENVKLKYELTALRNETNRLRFMLFSN